MIQFGFTRMPAGEPNEPIASEQPKLICRVDGEALLLSVEGESGDTLSGHIKKMGGSATFREQDTYDGFRWLFSMTVGSAYGSVLLLEKPSLKVEQIADGRWCVPNPGGAEHDHLGFDGLVDRLKAGGFEAELITRQSGYRGVAFPITPGEELNSFARLIPIITNV